MRKFLFALFLFTSITNYFFAQFNEYPCYYWKESEGERHRVSSYNTKGLNQDNRLIPALQSQMLCTLNNTSGVIKRIWFTIQSNDSSYLNDIKIKMVFDDETTVDNVPVGMLSGTGPWKVNDVTTPMFNIMRSRQGNRDQNGVGMGSFNMHWEMPFTTNCSIEIYNGTENNIKLFYYIDYIKIDHKTTPLLFHATYNAEIFTVPYNKATLDTDHNYRFLKKEGYRGKYAGTILCVESHPDREGKWYEGDDMFIIDNEPWPPRLHGTGTEDYFGMAWGIHRPYQAFDHGVTHYEKNLTDHDRFFDGRYVLYRLHLNDPVLFNQSIDASIEAGTMNDCRQHYESVAFWYGQRIN